MARTRLQKNAMMFENIKNVECGVIAKLFVLYLMASLVTNTESKMSTACHGLDNLGCVLHNLTCDSTSSVSITGGQYGFRPGCGKTTNCTITATGLPDCCLASPEYCVRMIDNKTLSDTDRSCSNRSSCTFVITEARESCKNLTVNAYSVIEYSCIPRITSEPPRLPPSTTQSTTTTLSTTELIVMSSSVSISSSANSDCTRAAVVGGVLGMIICILIALMVLEFVYFYRKLRILSMKQGGGNVISHYASTHRTNTIEEEKPAYDDLRRNHSDKAEAEKPAYDDLPSPQPKDDDRHYYNLDNARRTPNPIYCNLNNGAYSDIKK